MNQRKFKRLVKKSLEESEQKRIKKIIESKDNELEKHEEDNLTSYS